jgi:hypothetical protein
MKPRAWDPEVTVGRAIEALHLVATLTEVVGANDTFTIHARKQYTKSVATLQAMLDALGDSPHGRHWQTVAQKAGVLEVK